MQNDNSGNHPFPNAATPKAAYLPSTVDLLKAFVWRVGGTAPASPINILERNDIERLCLKELLFPCPHDVKSEYEARALVTKVVLCDGLWGRFNMGAPFDIYVYENGIRIYDDDEAIELGELFARAHEIIGASEMYKMQTELIELLLLPT